MLSLFIDGPSSSVDSETGGDAGPMPKLVSSPVSKLSLSNPDSSTMVTVGQADKPLEGEKRGERRFPSPILIDFTRALPDWNARVYRVDGGQPWNGVQDKEQQSIDQKKGVDFRMLK